MKMLTITAKGFMWLLDEIEKIQNTPLYMVASLPNFQLIFPNEEEMLYPWLFLFFLNSFWIICLKFIACSFSSRLRWAAFAQWRVCLMTFPTLWRICALSLTVPDFRVSGNLSPSEVQDNDESFKQNEGSWCVKKYAYFPHPYCPISPTPWLQLTF
jgi:hypothetical protein